MMRNCSPQRRRRTRTSPPYRATIRSKLAHGTKSMTCENSVRPRFTVMPPIGKIGQPTAIRQIQVQIDTKQNQLQPIALHHLFIIPLSLNRTVVQPDRNAAPSIRPQSERRGIWNRSAASPATLKIAIRLPASGEIDARSGGELVEARGLAIVLRKAATEMLGNNWGN